MYDIRHLYGLCIHYLYSFFVLFYIHLVALTYQQSLHDNNNKHLWKTPTYVNKSSSASVCMVKNDTRRIVCTYIYNVDLCYLADTHNFSHLEALFYVQVNGTLCYVSVASFSKVAVSVGVIRLPHHITICFEGSMCHWLRIINDHRECRHWSTH